MPTHGYAKVGHHVVWNVIRDHLSNLRIAHKDALPPSE